MSNSSSSPEATSDDFARPNALTAAEPVPDRWNYETTVHQIEAIVSRIEAGELELAEVFEQFAIAVEYLQQCETFLAQRQKQVDVLIETLTDDPEF